MEEDASAASSPEDADEGEEEIDAEDEMEAEDEGAASQKCVSDVVGQSSSDHAIPQVRKLLSRKRRRLICQAAGKWEIRECPLVYQHHVLDVLPLAYHMLR